MIRAAYIVAWLQIVCPIVRAADDAGSFVAYGTGNRLCSEWLQSRERNDADTVEMTAWTLGFISAYNKYMYTGIDVAGGLQDEDIHAAIDKHCAGRPYDSLSFATNALIERLKDADDIRGIDGLLNLFGKPNRRK